jgi:hypothetical protein
MSNQENTELRDEEVIKERETAEEHFNKKVDIAHKLRQLGAAVAMTASTIGGANAQENNSAEGLPSETNTQEYVVESSPNEEIPEITINLPEIKDYSYYRYMNNNASTEESGEYAQQTHTTMELNRKLQNGEMGYMEAKAAAEHIYAYPEGVRDIYFSGKVARLDDATNCMTNIAGYPKLTEGEDFVFHGQVYPPVVIPLTEEYTERLEKVENDAVKQCINSIESEVTRGLLMCISNDPTLTDEAKDSLMRKEIEDRFAIIDSGRYDTAEEEKWINRNRTSWKESTLRDLSEINPSLAEELRIQYSMPVKTIKNQAVSQRNDFGR